MRTAAAELLETLSKVAPKQWRATRTIWQLHTVSQVGQTAISNRLQKLRSLKLVECRRVHKEKHWRKIL
jgi:hypothetical protein